MMNRDNPVWLITGCSTGFGRELAKLVLERGWRAVVTARDASKVKDIAEAHGDRALVLPLDVTNRKQIDDVVAQAQAAFRPHRRARQQRGLRLSGRDRRRRGRRSPRHVRDQRVRSGRHDEGRAADHA